MSTESQKTICPICGKEFSSCKIQTSDDINFQTIECATFARKFNVSKYIFDNSKSKIVKTQALNLILEFMLRKPYKGQGDCWYFIYNDSKQTEDTENIEGIEDTEDTKKESIYVNLYSLLKTYPESTMQKIDRGLLNLSLMYPQYGTEISKVDSIHMRALFCESEDIKESITILSFMEELGYLKMIDGNAYSISAEGWKKIDELQKSEKHLKNAFIAMSFNFKDENILNIKNTFEQAIRNAGYSPVAICDKEHNNQIVPEILHEIRQSRFLVLDTTYPNNGAYYEAGYAMGLGKEVIACCKKSEFKDNVHFDIAQKNLVIWEDIDDLKNRLTKRIEATVY